jgi:hypothetical protein
MSSNSPVLTRAAVLVAVMAYRLGYMAPGDEPETLPQLRG